MRLRTGIILLTVLGALVPHPGVAGSLELRSVAYGAVDFGDLIPFRVNGSGCEDVPVRVRVLAGVAGAEVLGPASSPRVDGVDPSGCTGAAVVPGFVEVTAAGWRQGDPISIEMSSAAGTVPLRYSRIEVDHGTPAAGAPAIVPANDQDTGDHDHAVSMSAGDSIGLGRVDLGRVESMSLRLCALGTPSAAETVPPLSVFGNVGAYERLEAPIYASIRQDAPTGPALIGPIDISSNLTTGPRLAVAGSGGCFRLLPLPVTGRRTADAPELFVTVDAGLPGALTLNSVDINGTAAKLPDPPAADPPGMTTIFDGTSFEGWSQSNCMIRDGAATNARTGRPTEVGGCSMTYDRPTRNLVLRLELRRRSFFDNGGIWMPSEIQLRSVGEFLPGGFFGEYQARRLKLNTFPDWSEMEIVQLGGRYVVTVNGRTVTDHLARAGAPSPYRLRIAGQPEWSYRTGASAGFGHELSPDVEQPSEMGDFWFRNIRLYECASETDPVCTTLADARLGQAPAK